MMLNTTLNQELKEEFVIASGERLSPANNPAEFAVFLYEKLLKEISAAIAEELVKNPENKLVLTSFQKNLEQKLGSPLI